MLPPSTPFAVFDEQTFKSEPEFPLKPVQRLKDLVVPQHVLLDQEDSHGTLWGGKTRTTYRHSLLDDDFCYYYSGHPSCYYTPAPTPGPTPGPTPAPTPTPTPTQTPGPSTPDPTAPPSDDFIETVEGDLDAALAGLSPSSIHVTDTTGPVTDPTDDAPACSKVVLFEMDATDTSTSPATVRSFRVFIIFPADTDQDEIDQFVSDLINNPETIFVSFDPNVWTFQLTFGPVQDQLPLDSDRGSECCPGNSGTDSECAEYSDASDSETSSSAPQGRSSSSDADHSSSSEADDSSDDAPGSPPVTDSDGDTDDSPRLRSRQGRDSDDDSDASNGQDDEDDDSDDDGDDDSSDDEDESQDGSGRAADTVVSDFNLAQPLRTGFAAPFNFSATAVLPGNTSNTTEELEEIFDELEDEEPVRERSQPMSRFLVFDGNGTLGDLRPSVNGSAPAGLGTNSTSRSSLTLPPNVTVPLLISKSAPSNQIRNSQVSNKDRTVEAGKRGQQAEAEYQLGDMTLGTFVSDPGGSSMPIIGGMLVNQVSYQHTNSKKHNQHLQEVEAAPSLVIPRARTASMAANETEAHTKASGKSKSAAATIVVLLATIGAVAAATIASMFYKWHSASGRGTAGLKRPETQPSVGPASDTDMCLHVPAAGDSLEGSTEEDLGVLQRISRTLRETRDAQLQSIHGMFSGIIPSMRETVSHLCSANIERPAEFNFTVCDSRSQHDGMSLQSSARGSVLADGLRWPGEGLGSEAGGASYRSSDSDMSLGSSSISALSAGSSRSWASAAAVTFEGSTAFDRMASNSVATTPSASARGTARLDS